METIDKLRTLVLSQSFIPQRVIPWEEAVSLVVCDKARVVEAYEATVSSPSITIAVPAVISYVKGYAVPRKAQRFSRRGVLSRDDYRCQYCGARKLPRELNYDHVIPRKLGGKTVWDNIVTCCYPCNTRKGGRTPEQAGMKLLRQPTRPMFFNSIFMYEGDKPEQWEPYLS